MGETEILSRATSALPKKKNVSVSYTELQDFEDTSTKGPVQQDLRPPNFQAWPTQPKPLVLARRDQILYAVFDGALIALPVCLIIKTVLCLYAHNQDLGNTGVYIDQASYLSQVLIQLNSQLVTLFTIVFVTIISTFVKRYALWKAQHGAYVSDLEQLQGSVSLPSTLKLIWSLRSFGVKSIILTLIWSFYYLGSQAVKLEYRMTLSEGYGNMDAAIQKSNAPGYFSPDLSTILKDSTYTTPYDVNNRAFYMSRLNTKFGATILENQDETNTMPGSQPNPGSRNGPLVPDYHDAMTNVMQKGLTNKLEYLLSGYIDVSKRSQLSTSYVTLIGQSLWLDSVYNDNGTMQHTASPEALLGTYTLLNMSYINVTCSTPIIHETWAFPNGTVPNSLVSFNMTPSYPNATTDQHGYPLREFSYWYKTLAIDPIPGLDPYPTDYNGTYNYTTRAAQTQCSLTTRYIDMMVQCITTGCYASRLRWANNTSEYNATGYSTPFDNDVFAANFLSNYTLSTGYQDDPSLPALVEQEFGASSELNGSLSSTIGPAVCLGCNMSLDTSLHFQNAGVYITPGFNTYYTISQSVVYDFIQPDLAALVTSSTHEDQIFKRVSARGAALNQGYRIFWQWIPVDFVACSILLVAAVGACWLRMNTLAPDIFGYVSSLTRDNPHLQLPTEGSALSGIDRARMLKGVKVRLGDVQRGQPGESSIGRVGLAPVDAQVRPLYSQGVYV